MSGLSVETRRELFGALLGVMLGVPVGMALVSNFDLPQTFTVPIITALFVVIIGTLIRGRLGWLLVGAVIGVCVAQFFFSAPKFNVAHLGFIPGVIAALVLMVLVDLFSVPKPSRVPDKPCPAE